MDERDWLAERFEEHRTHLRAVAYRMLGSLSEADDAVPGGVAAAQLHRRERARQPGRLADDRRRADHEPIEVAVTRGREERVGDLPLRLEVGVGVVLRVDHGGVRGSRELRGAAAVARQARGYAQLPLDIRPALVNGAVAAVAFLHGQPFSIGAVTVRNGKIVELDFLNDPERLRRLELTILDD
jgi:hypothetical protein